MEPEATMIRTSCPHCHAVVEVPTRDVKLHVDPQGDRRSRGRYAFVCPGCSRVPVKVADDAQVRFLTARGCEVIGSGRVGRPPPPEQRAEGPPLTYDDLLDLHLLLQRDDWFEHLLALG